ncbi:hypothetical protein ANCCAN_20158 [Ancylostoma caninum]|uniref:Peptidase M13 C-terminal domain-containing protein n=1 Tax=Ancylostoma caninum TaxID=29170 RepID=A0A368FT84_ANCCA|nr:hypothetical protein ANCCAN_20158 [Ancylostoma caninum]
MHTNPGPWLDREFYTQFEERTTCLEKIYTDSKIPGFTGKVDGKITLNENIADNEGVKLAFKVHRKLGKKLGADGRFEEMQEFNNDQMFFLSYAMFFCNKNAYNQKYLRRWVSTSIYAPDMLR